MKKINIFLCLLAIVVGVTACYEDKGNYDYKDLISLELDTVGMNLSAGKTAYQFENFTLDPKVKYAGNETDLEYLWKLYLQVPPRLPEGVTKYDSAKVLSHEPIIDEVIYDVPGDYYLTLEVTDKVSDTKTYLTFKLKIESAVSRGICVLEEWDGVFDLSMIKNKRLIPELEESRAGVEYNIFSNVNKGQTMSDGKFLSQLSPRGVAGDFFVFTSTGMYKLSRNSFELMSDDYSSLFSFSAGMTFKPQAHITVTSNSPAEYLLNNGKIHTMRYMYSDIVFGDYVSGGEYEAMPFLVKIPNANNYVLFFDKLNKRFLPINKWGDVINVYESTPSEAFDVNYIDKELFYLEQGYNNLTYAVFNDKGTSNYYLYEADFSGEQAAPKAVYDMSVCTGIDENTIFTFANRGAYCFYVSKNHLYRYNYTSNTCQDAIPAFNGETITAMKIFKKANHELDGQLLIVATCNEVGEGKMYFLDFNAISGTIDEAGLANPYNGFGRIQDFMDKE